MPVTSEVKRRPTTRLLAKLGDRAINAADGIPGSTTQWAVRLVGAHSTQLANCIASDVDTMV